MRTSVTSLSTPRHAHATFILRKCHKCDRRGKRSLIVRDPDGRAAALLLHSNTILVSMSLSRHPWTNQLGKRAVVAAPRQIATRHTR